MKTTGREERIERLMETKTFTQLTQEEKEFVLKELGSEEQYQAMRRVTLALITSKADLSPDPEILKSLQSKMSGRTSASFSFANLFSFRIPAYVSVILAGIAAVATWFVMLPREGNSQPKIVEVIKMDTVFVERVKIDTVFNTRFIYRQAKSDVTIDKNYFQVVKKTSEPAVESEVGVSMKDKQELETLLVSGSE